MDFVSDNLIFIVFIVIALVSQIGRLLVRNAERRKREEGAGDRQEASAYNAYEYGDDAEDKDDDDAFSAWTLPVDDDEAAVPAVAVPVSPVAVPFFAPLVAPAPVPGHSPFPALIADLTPVAEKYGREAAFSSSTRELEPSINARRKGRNAVPAAFPEKLDYLPPLKRAVVLAEILGPPKGL